MTLYEELVTNHIPIDHHESDLYFKTTDKSMEILKKYEVESRNARPFRSLKDHTEWTDVPFAYIPYWEKRQNRNQ
jgi:hypothetical protein